MKNKLFGKWLKVIVAIILVSAVIWAGKGIFKYSIFSTHDGDHHIARAFDAVQTIKEGEFPLRWAGSLNYLCGVPIYNFYYPLLYYLVILGDLVTKNIIFILQVIFFISLLLGTVGFYLWAKEETGKQLPAIAGALVYLFAPYRFILIFVRGSPEYLAYAILPVVLYLYAKTFNSKDKKFVVYAFLASILGAILTISHNFAAMFLVPMVLLYIVVKIILLKLDIKKIGWLALSFFGSLGMGSFFIGPAILEQKYTQIGANFIMWKDHFPELWQLWNSKWGYFYSSEGTINDGMSFMLGYAQWVILALALIFIIYRLIKMKFKIGAFIKENVWILIFFFGSLFTLYLILPWSIPVWERIRPLQEIQFSWRLLGTAVFTIATLFTFVLDKIKSKKLLIALAVGISLFSVVAERNHMLPQPVAGTEVYKYADFEKLHQHRYSTTTLADEVIAAGAPGACWFDVPLIASEKDALKFSVVERGNTYGFVKFELPKNHTDKILRLGLGYFPGIYTFILDGQRITKYDDCNGRVCLPADKLRDGENFISWKVGESPTEKLFDYITIAFFGAWILFLIIRLTGIYKNKQRTILLLLSLLIFGIFMFFRTYNVSGRVGLGWDQERDARAAVNILSGHLTLLGPRVQGPMGFFLPPYFFYLIVPFYAITHMSPYATTAFIGFWSVLFFGISYFLLSKVFNNKIALIFLSLWAVNSLAISIDALAWNPVAIPLLIIVMVYLIHLYYLDHKLRNLFFIGATLGVGISFHVQFLFCFFLALPVIVDVIKRKKVSGLPKMVFGFIIPFLPILIFDLRHNFLNTKMVLGFLGTISQVNRVFAVWDNVVAFVLGIPPTRVVSFVFYLAVAGLLFWLGRSMKDKAQRGIFTGFGLTWIVTLPIFYLFVKNPSEYYFNYMLVIVCILGAYLLSLKKFGILILCLIMIYFAWKSIPTLYSSHLNLREKDAVVVALQKLTKGRTPFNVSFDVPANEDAGFRYLLDYHGVKYTGDPKDPLIEFEIPSTNKSSSYSFGDIGLYFPSGWLKDNWLK